MWAKMKNINFNTIHAMQLSYLGVLKSVDY